MTPSEPRAGATSVRGPVLLAAAFYLSFTIVALAAHGWNPLWFLWIGDKFADLNPSGRSGYDGQFVYYVAVDGFAAAPHLDNPPYRLTRIVLPLAARLLAGGIPTAVPWAIVAINLAAIVATTWLLARRLAGNGASPWFALAYPFYVGTFLAYSRALTEPLAFFLAAAGSVAWLGRRRHHAVWLLALAALTKEITAVFAVGLAAAEIAGRRFAAAAVALATVLPLLLWWGYVHRHFAAAGHRFAREALLSPIPLGGVMASPSLDPGYVSAVAAVAIPAVLLLPVSAACLGAEAKTVPAWVVLAHCLWVILLPEAVYDHVMAAGRNAAGLVVALLVALPLRGNAAPLAACALWTIPTLVWLPPVLLWSPWGPPLRDVLRTLLG
jgi:hypothetical protein